MGLTLQVKGLNELKAQIKAYPQDIDKIIQNEFVAFGDNVVSDAKRLAPVDEGYLRNSISASVTDLELSISVNVDYAAYLEFGTKSFAAEYVASLPPEWQTFASEFQGPTGGSFADFVKILIEWVKRKGFAAQVTKSGGKSKSGSSVAGEQQAAYLIAKSILIKGIRPQPYLFPAFEQNKQGLIDNLKSQLGAK